MKLVFFCPNTDCQNHRGVAYDLADWESMQAEFETMGLPPMDGTNCYCGEWLPVADATQQPDEWEPEPEPEIPYEEETEEPPPPPTNEGPEEPDPW